MNASLDEQFTRDLAPILPGLRSTALRYANGNHELADDILQDATLKVWRFYETGYQQGTNFRAFMHRALRNAHADYWVKAKRQPLLISRDADPNPSSSEYGVLTGTTVSAEDTLMDYLVDPDLRAAIHALPVKFQQPLVMNAAGYTYAEIAAEMQIPLGTVMSRIHRARGKAAALLAGSPVVDAAEDEVA